MRTTNLPIVLVTGDAILAWDFIHRTGHANVQSVYEPEDQLTVYRQSGGAWHMTRILEELKKKEGWNWEIRGVGPQSAEQFDVPPYIHKHLSHAYTVWTEFRRSLERPDEKAIRVKSYLGSEQRREGPPADWFPSLPSAEDQARLRLIVVTDDGMEKGYATHRPDLLEALPALAREQGGPWFIWKQWQLAEERGLVKALSAGKKGRSQLVQENPQAIKALYSRAIAVINVGALRKGARGVGHGLSWDSLAEQTRNAVLENEELRLFRYVIVLFTNSGALIVTPEHTESSWSGDALLVCDPAELEGTWAGRYEGGTVGSTTCLVAAVAKGLMEHVSSESLDAPDLARYVEEGLGRMRALHYLGYFSDQLEQGAEPSKAAGRTLDEFNPTTRYATQKWEELSKLLPYLEKDKKDEKAPRKDNFLRIPVPVAKREEVNPWTLLKDLLRTRDKLDELARDVARRGPKKALKQVPRAVFGKLITTDPREIDALRAIGTLLRNYVNDPGDKPLSLAVFGSPGSGKSFGVRQLAEQLGKAISEKTLTFNLSQLSHPDMLVGAFHQIRDEGLKGKIPLVFWDEFDTALGGADLGWLRYFLAPMQDGEFQEGQVTHPIGRAIFVFAGGTCPRMELFYPGSKEAQGKQDEADKLKKAKVPDFVSRLRGYLDIPGLDHSSGSGAELSAHLLVRRAIILHQHMSRIGSITEDGQVRVDDALLNAFLRVEKYKHGARSMEAIVRMSSFQGTRSFTPSCLPGPEQLELHVDPKQFRQLLG